MTVTVFDTIGGEDAVRALVERFYDLVESEQEGAQLRRLHSNGHGLAHARIEQFNFMCGFLGGRQHYMEKHGHLNVKQMHAHVPVRREDADSWLLLMDKAMAEVGIAQATAKYMHMAFERVATALVNEVVD